MLTTAFALAFTSSVTKKKSVNQNEKKIPVKIWIAARKNRCENPSVKEAICALIAGAKCQIRPTISSRTLSCDSEFLLDEKKIEDDDAL